MSSLKPAGRTVTTAHDNRGELICNICFTIAQVSCMDPIGSKRRPRTPRQAHELLSNPHRRVHSANCPSDIYRTEGMQGATSTRHQGNQYATVDSIFWYASIDVPKLWRMGGRTAAPTIAENVISFETILFEPNEAFSPAPPKSRACCGRASGTPSRLLIGDRIVGALMLVILGIETYCTRRWAGVTESARSP